MSLPADTTVTDGRERIGVPAARLNELVQEQVRVPAAIQSLRAAQGGLPLDLGGAPMGLVKLMGRVGVRRRCRLGAWHRGRRLGGGRGRGGLGCGVCPD